MLPTKRNIVKSNMLNTLPQDQAHFAYLFTGNTERDYGKLYKNTGGIIVGV